MANIKSQKKRIGITKAENARNTAKKTRVKNAVKKYEAFINAADVAKAKAYLPELVSIIDKASADGVYKKETASRKVARVTKLLYTLEQAK
jgi:small subunit ribosomal protein S20